MRDFRPPVPEHQRVVERWLLSYHDTLADLVCASLDCDEEITDGGVYCAPCALMPILRPRLVTRVLVRSTAWLGGVR